MERYDFKSVASLVDSTSFRKSRDLLFSSSIRAPSLVPVFRHQKLTDFSVSRILGLEEDGTQKESKCPAPVLCRHPIQTPSPQHSDSADTSPRLSPCSDNASSASDFESEPDQVSTHSEQPPRKRRQRTTFSPTEVWELERAYRRQPYLMSEDEEELVQRLGITAKSLKYWFQSRRAKSRKEDSRVAPGYQSSRSNEFGRQVRRAMPSDRPHAQSLIQSLSDHLSHPMEDHLKVRAQSQPIKGDYQYLSFKSNRLRTRSSLLVPLYHLDQFKKRPVKSARLPHSSGLRRYQPY